MEDEVEAFCAIIENRSDENRQAMRRFDDPHRVLSPAFSILRQELDSMIRVIYLLQITDLSERERLIKATLSGGKWKLQTNNGKFRDVTDREMVEIAQQLEGWTRSVYRFGCAFVHLSEFHNHLAENPFQKLSDAERQDILSHMRNYHGGPSCDSPDMKEISEYLPRIFNKIADNLIFYLAELRNGKTKSV
jgi:hypothetical protein